MQGKGHKAYNKHALVKKRKEDNIMLKLTLNTTLTVSTLKEYTTQGYDVVWFTNYNGGTSLNALTVDEDPTDEQAVKVGLSNQDFENFAVDIKTLQQALSTNEPITVISVADNFLTVNGGRSVDIYHDNH